MSTFSTLASAYFKKLGMLLRRHKPTIVCSNDIPRFNGNVKFATLALIWENVIMMDSLEIVAGSDLGVG